MIKRSNSHTTNFEDLPCDAITSLPNGCKVVKDDLRIEVCGTIDELNSFIGLLVTELPVELVNELHNVQRKLFAVGGLVAGINEPSDLPVSEDVLFLKQRIADIQKCCGTLHNFVLPGGCHAAALADVCRTVCRRAERQLVSLEAYSVLPYMNRLSTYLFYLSRYLNYFYNQREIYLT